MATPHAKAFTLFELVVVLCVVAVLAGVFVDRVWFYQEQAEKAGVEQVAAALQSALTLQLADLIVRGREADAVKLGTENPMNWLVKKPSNYAGEFFEPTPGTVAPGAWLFDLKSHDLIYMVDSSRFFTPGRDGVKWIRFHVYLMQGFAPRDGAKGTLKATGAVIQPVESYLWFDRRL